MRLEGRLCCNGEAPPPRAYTQRHLSAHCRPMHPTFSPGHLHPQGPAQPAEEPAVAQVELRLLLPGRRQQCCGQQPCRHRPIHPQRHQRGGCGGCTAAGRVPALQRGGRDAGAQRPGAHAARHGDRDRHAAPAGLGLQAGQGLEALRRGAGGWQLFLGCKPVDRGRGRPMTPLTLTCGAERGARGLCKSLHLSSGAQPSTERVHWACRRHWGRPPSCPMAALPTLWPATRRPSTATSRCARQQQGQGWQLAGSFGWVGGWVGKE